jgi:plastocyanin
MGKRSVLLRLGGGALVVALLAGCGHGGGAKGTTSTGTTGTTDTLVVEGFHVLAIVDFHETEYRIEPRSVGFQVPGYFGIRAVNDGTIPHALTVSGHGVRRSTGTIPPGSSKTIAVWFKAPGVYELYCPLDGHRQRGMRARIRVR